MPDSYSSAWGRIGAHTKWAKVTDRSAATARAREAFDRRFLEEPDGDEERAAHMRKAYFQRLALKSAEVRRAKRDGLNGS
jgi:hypothetical protein